MTELVIEDKLLYVLADRSFYEPLSLYKTSDGDFHQPLLRILPDEWILERWNLWWNCRHPSSQIPPQGWKIHISATLSNAPPVLLTVARELFAAGASFKFVADRSLLAMVNGKRWHRGGAGKFITAYPKDTEQCRELLERLHQATIGYWGPYILSDRRYRDSRIVHYRYGGLLPTRRMDVSGRTVMVIQNHQGDLIDDERAPYFKLPEGVEDPFLGEAPQQSQDDVERGTLKNGRYKIERVLAISNSGGVYRALDRENDRQVLIKEARPYTNVSPRGLDAVQLLKKEHRLLTVLADTGISPRPFDFFFDWEHAYLVEEYLQGGRSIRDYVTDNSLSLRTRPTIEHSIAFFRLYRNLFQRLARAVKSLHDRNIIFSDLSIANVMVIEAMDADVPGMDPVIKIIDFEGAYEEGVDIPAHLFTPGFSPREAIERGHSMREDDCYALGSMLMSGLVPMNQLLELDPNAHRRYLAAIQRDFDLPAPIAELISALLDVDPSRRPDAQRMIDVLADEWLPRAPALTTQELDGCDLEEVIGRTLTYIESVADFERTDRLYPADPMVFETNPLNLAHGACGVAYVLGQVRGTLDDRVLDWIFQHPIEQRRLPPGLYNGLSGIAWTLLELGQTDRAAQALAESRDHPLLWRSASLFSGAAGWGMAQLRLLAATGDRVHLELAREAGRYLIESREFGDDPGAGCFWTTPEGVSASLAHGAAGVSLFLLYLHLASADESYLDVGRQGMDWVLGQGFKNNEGGLTWLARDRTPSYTPYWRWGSSGIGRVLLRYWLITGDARYATALEDLHIDCDRKYTIFPGYFFGLAGIAELYLDMARFERWSSIAEPSLRRILSGCLLFPVERETGLAFPGESLSRISCDFGTGGAGIALVMHRYRKRNGASFMLDQLLPGWSSSDRCSE